MEARKWRCPSQLLHLSALLPTSPNFIYSNHQRLPCPRHSLVSYKGYRGLLFMVLKLFSKYISEGSLFMSALSFSFRAASISYRVTQVNLTETMEPNQGKNQEIMFRLVMCYTSLLQISPIRVCSRHCSNKVFALKFRC